MFDDVTKVDFDMVKLNYFSSTCVRTQPESTTFYCIKSIRNYLAPYFDAFHLRKVFLFTCKEEKISRKWSIWFDL